MNTLESFAITILMGVLQSVVKNPAHKAAVQGQMTGIATEILEAYGYTVTPPATLPAV
jgi:hypothetical protein